MRSGLTNIQWGEKTYVFIDSQNVNLAIRDQGWQLDWNKLFRHLVKKYHAEKVYLFIGYIPLNQSLYTRLQNIGYILVFKPVLDLGSGRTKGNVDAELVLQAMIEYTHYTKAILITGDGDFACLVRYLREQEKFKLLIVPNQSKYSSFLRIEARGNIDSLTNKRTKLEYIKKDAT
ncbi:NYN domain-containing protein [Candidatus Gracilibacteria bacterium]|nr:NYN domain-containing protein [Candidatus Gracilibacteria bacterium]